MYIEKIHIETFGKLTNVDIELAKGVNIIEGANESGKSTLAAFIKFVLYGVPSREREGVLSWQTGVASGSITLRDAQKSYRIERTLVGKREAVQMIDGDTNMPVRHALEGTTPGELFFGVDAEMFAATAYVSQLGSTAPGGSKVSEGIENILFSADESVNTQRALAKLDSMRAALLHKNEKGGRLYELDEECAAAEVRLSESMKIHGEILAKEAQLADIREKYAAAVEKSREISSRVEQYEARVLVEMFEKKQKIERKLSELKNDIEAVSDTDVEAAYKLEETINKIELLADEAQRANDKLANTPLPEPDAQLDEYTAKGGRQVLEAQQGLCRTRAKAYTAVGMVVLLMGLALVGIGIVPMFASGTPLLWGIISGAVLAALAITMLVLGARARAAANDIGERYDFDELERRIAEWTAASEASKLAQLAAANASARYDEACDDALRVYGCGVDELGVLLSEYKEKLRAAAGIKAEYDKYASVLAQIKTQVESYSEAELRERIDETVDLSDINADSLPTMRREAEFAEKMATSLEKHIAELEKTLAGLYPTLEEPTKAADKLSALVAERKSLRKRHAAYKLAAAKLSEASELLRESISPRLASDTALLMAHITGGKYKELGVGTELELCAQTESGTKSIGALSAGTQDAAYLCLRMALISLLYRKELPPVIYDESFSRQDDTRLANMMKLIHLQEAQSIIFTSNSREADAMRSIGEFEHVRL